MWNWTAIGVLLVLGCQCAGVVRADSDSDSDSSSSGELKSKPKTIEHKYNNPAYPTPYGFGYPYQPYGYNQMPPYPYPQPPMPGYYNPYRHTAPPPPPPLMYPPPIYQPDPAAYRGAYPPQTGEGPTAGWNANPPTNQVQPQQPSPGQGSGPSAPYPPGGSSVINHSLKVNKEYNEDGHHSNTK
ncbi:cyclin-K [Drosophila gunungcola]|uniref:CG16743 protein n=1 Tax=Drosophila gunungcola TaxID=103775 RepID=A0A9P9YTB9_9MUSC|nr:cyclin-K [Drosophila gunungcola]KAI8042706.1 hypothetical protein M5D96_004023 [Drosophila gunungcola]